MEKFKGDDKIDFLIEDDLSQGLKLKKFKFKQSFVTKKAINNLIHQDLMVKSIPKFQKSS